MRPVILDVDTGVDDAMALLLAARHPGLGLLAVSCVAGNAPLPDVVRNTLTVLRAAERPDVPVAAGAAGPLLPAAWERPRVHGADGMGELGWPAGTRPADPRHAVELLRDTLLAAARHGRAVTLLALAPLTNLALLLRTWPAVAAGLREVVVVGGAVGGDPALAVAEFNVRRDPEAAAIVLAAAAELDVPVTMYAMEVFAVPVVTREQADDLVRAGGRSATELAGRLAAFQCRRRAADAATIGDAGAVCAVLEPAGMRVRAGAVAVQLVGANRGRTTVGEPARRGAPVPESVAPPASPVRLVTDVDGPRYARLWLEAMR